MCVDATGRPQFEDLLFHRGEPCFFSFDLLIRDGVDLCTSALVDRKQELRRLLAGVKTAGPILYVDHVEGTGIALFERVCELDLEGIVAKRKFAPYKTAREESTWMHMQQGQAWGARRMRSFSLKLLFVCKPQTIYGGGFFGECSQLHSCLKNEASGRHFERGGGNRGLGLTAEGLPASKVEFRQREHTMPDGKLNQTFKKTFLSVESDINGFMALVVPDCEWTMMATGEKFTGTEKIRSGRRIHGGAS